jgi:hypothetical protein
MREVAISFHPLGHVAEECSVQVLRETRALGCNSTPLLIDIDRL